jgi:hypothetical protein
MSWLDDDDGELSLATSAGRPSRSTRPTSWSRRPPGTATRSPAPPWSGLVLLVNNSLLLTIECRVSERMWMTMRERDLNT